ncbi:MAG: hypothetical protein GY847_32660 [Proteobacteria bacterium]|nr:hypothetical protein [Pseudomonadota bacterium]
MKDRIPQAGFVNEGWMAGQEASKDWADGGPDLLEARGGTAADIGGLNPAGEARRRLPAPGPAGLEPEGVLWVVCAEAHEDADYTRFGTLCRGGPRT